MRKTPQLPASGSGAGRLLPSGDKISKCFPNLSEFVLTWSKTDGSASSWRNKISSKCTIAKSLFSPGPRRSALPRSLSGSLEVSPSSGSPSPCPGVSKGGRSFRKGARSHSQQGRGGVRTKTKYVPKMKMDPGVLM